MNAPTTIGPYRVEREIGRGGMGVVYLARDTRLDRPVALKALPAEMAADPERLQRFEREARLLASLHHPNIAGIYGVEEAGGRRYLALEYVEGETLFERLARGPLPVDDVIALGAQIAAGIEAAHESGVIHRDLKPGNIVIAPDDTPKLLDFGLAKGKVAEPGQSPTLLDSPATMAAQSPTLAHSPTQISPATMPGVILGTAGYLSPEQARGKAVDRRTDIWSFGCILFECLTGRMLFQGETVSDTIAKILEREVDWTQLPASTPPALRALLARCLEKDPKRRLRDIGEARLLLDELRAPGGARDRSGLGLPGADHGAADAAAGRRRGIGYGTIVLTAAGILAGLAIASLAGRGMRNGGEGVTHLSVTIPKEIRFFDAGLTGDGRTLVLLGQPRTAPGAAEPQRQLYLRRFDMAEPEPIRGTEGTQQFLPSPDGRWLTFLAPVAERSTQRRLFKVPLDGSAPPVPICNWEDSWGGAPAWLESGDLLTPTVDGKSWVRIPTKGGSPGAPKAFDVPRLECRSTFASVLPGDRGVLLNSSFYEHGAFHLGIGVLDLKSGASKLLIPEGSNAVYSPTGHLLFTRGDALLAIPFDPGKLETRGEPAAILDGLRIGAAWQNARLWFAPNGTLLYLPGGNVARDRKLVVLGPGGEISDWSGERQSYEANMDVSRDGARAAMVIANAGGIYEIWLSEKGNATSRRIVAREGVDCAVPLWSPDGRRIAYTAVGEGKGNGVYVAPSDGSGTPVLVGAPPDSTVRLAPTSWTPDGTQLLLALQRGGKLSLGVVSANPEPGRGPAAIRPLFPDDALRGLGLVSPDGATLAYITGESGQVQINLVAWGPGGPGGTPVPVSANAGNTLFWSADSRQLYYVDNQQKLMAVAVSRPPQLSASPPGQALALDKLAIAGGLIKALPGGRFLAVRKGENEGEIDRLDAVLHFDREIRERFSKAKR